MICISHASSQNKYVCVVAQLAIRVQNVFLSGLWSAFPVLTVQPPGALELILELVVQILHISLGHFMLILTIGTRLQGLRPS